MTALRSAILALVSRAPRDARGPRYRRAIREAVEALDAAERIAAMPAEPLGSEPPPAHEPIT